jgi:PAS domain S-box-containing protein
MDREVLETIQVLHVDDDPEFADLAATFVTQEDDRFTVDIVTSAGEAIERLTEEQIDCIVSDYDMPGQNGIQLLETVRERHPDLPFILYTGKGSEEVASEAISAGVSDYLQKGTSTERYELLANRILTHVEQTRTQRELEEREAHLRHAQAVADFGSWKLDPTTGEMEWSAEVYRILGLSEEEPMSYAKALSYVLPEDRDFVEEELTAALEGDEFNIEHRIVTEDGSTGWVRQQAEVETDETGTPTEALGVIQDITAFKEREQRLREERDRREALFRNSTDPIVEIEFDDKTPIIVAVNDAFREVFGFEPEEVVKEPVSEVLVPEETDHQTHHDGIKQQVLEGDPVNTTVCRQTHDGPRDFLLRVFPLDITDGQRGSYAMYTEITKNLEPAYETP